MSNFDLASFGIDRLNRDERIELASAILQSVVEIPDKQELPPWLIAELDRRMDAYEKDPSQARAWDDVFAELTAKYAE
ncbi:addiction module protein [Anatilimnocola floriformis]|uniref:addiction module protein n=1 Tax=Anatilimnocola floriformis TaxID=2948575 RepID=UPI0020C427F8|nr:addiction module protein [Anatilimnocola floriformis]